MKRTTVLILICMLSALAAAQESATLEQVMKLHRQALGGADAAVSYVTGTLEYDVTYENSSGSLTAIHGESGNYRELRFMGKRKTEAVYTDGTAYIINNSTGLGRSAHGADGDGLDLYYMNLYKSSAVIFPLFFAESHLSADVALQSSEPNGYVVTATYPDGTKRTFTLGKNMLIETDVTHVQSDKINLFITRVYRNYSSFDGGTFPRTTEIRIQGSLTIGGLQQSMNTSTTLHLKTAEGNTNTPPSSFYVDGPAFVTSDAVIQRGPFRFQYKGETPVGYDPESIQSADIDGDGNADLVTGNDGSASLLRGDGTGRFPSAVNLPGGGGSNEFVLPLNWDQDEDIELLVASTAAPEERVLVLSRDSAGEYAATQELITGDFPEALATADFDADGNPDVAVPHNRSGDLWVHFGNGIGGVREYQPYELEGRGENLATADVNGDGFTDILVVDQQALYVLLNDGNGIFVRSEPIAAGEFPFCVAAADFNGDGAMDAAVGNGGIFTDTGSQDISIHYGNGDGSFAEAEFISAGASIASILAADLDLDGDADLAAASFGNHTAVLLENSAGTLALSGSLPTSWSPAAITTGDFNGDGLPDLAIANEHGDNVTVWLNVLQKND